MVFEWREIMIMTDPSIKKYEITNGDPQVSQVLLAINDEIKKIPLRTIVADILLTFQKKHNIKKSEIGAKLLELNNNISLLGYTTAIANFGRTIRNWYNAPQSMFTEQGKRHQWTGKEKLISLMLYTQMYNEAEAEDMLLNYGFENLYIFDYFEACAKITWRLGGNYESFLTLLERKEELLPEDNRVEYNKTIYTPQALEEFNCIKQIEIGDDPDVSFVSFVQAYCEQFGRTHKSSFKWLCDMLSQAPESTGNYSFIEKMIRERDSLISNKARRAQKIGHEYVCKYSNDANVTALQMHTRNDYRFVVELFLESSQMKSLPVEKYCETKNKLLRKLEQSQYAAVEQLIGEILIDNHFIVDMLEYEATKEIILNRPWMEISQEECNHMLSNEASVSRRFLLINVLTNMSFQYIENNYIKPIEDEDDIDLPNMLPDIIINSLNNALISFGFGVLRAENGGIDYLLLTAIYSVNYNKELEPFPFRIFSVGNWDVLREVDENLYVLEEEIIKQEM